MSYTVIFFAAAAVAGVAWFKLRKSSKKEEPEEPQVERIDVEVFARSAKSKIPLGSTIHVGDDTYEVEERCQYCEVEDGDSEDETLVSEEDYWWVLNLMCEVSDDRFFLSCEQDHNDCWNYWFCEEITAAIKDLEAFQSVSYDNEGGSPPEEFEYRGHTYRANADEMDETYFVISERQDRSAKSEFFVQSTSYQEYLSDGSEGDKVIAFEMWEKGMTATIGWQVEDVLLIP